MSEQLEDYFFRHKLDHQYCQYDAFRRSITQLSQPISGSGETTRFQDGALLVLVPAEDLERILKKEDKSNDANDLGRNQS